MSEISSGVFSITFPMFSSQALLDASAAPLPSLHPTTLDLPALHEAVVVAHEQMRFDLLERVQTDADHDEEARPAEEAREVRRDPHPDHEGGQDGDDRQEDGDIARTFGNVTVKVDKMSDPYLNGATIDFVDTIEKQGFTIDNPNAQGSCACGDSFN